MRTITPGWDLEVRRGPGWLLVKPRASERELGDPLSLGNALWSLLDRHLVYRLVVELDEITLLDSELIGQLVDLSHRVKEQGGLLRLCGLSAYNERVLGVSGLIDQFPAYSCLEEAVLGVKPTQPR